MGLTSSEVLYMADGGVKRCDRCVMWWKGRDRCSVVKGVVKDHQVCGLYVHGKPQEIGESVTLAHVDPEVAGLGAGDTKCGNCRHGGGERCAHPDLQHFLIDNEGGCCNAWAGKTRLGKALNP